MLDPDISQCFYEWWVHFRVVMTRSFKCLRYRSCWYHFSRCVGCRPWHGGEARQCMLLVTRDGCLLVCIQFHCWRLFNTVALAWGTVCDMSLCSSYFSFVRGLFEHDRWIADRESWCRINVRTPECYGCASTTYSVEVLATMYREDQTACTVYMEAMTTLSLNE